MLRITLALLVTVVLAGPAFAWSIRGVELSPNDAARVDRQCDSLRFRTSRSLFESPPPEPAAGTIVSDPSSYWAENADASDAALVKSVDLNAITVRDCRRAGFYDN